MTKKSPASPDYTLFPATVLIDTREQTPWQFRGLRSKVASGEMKPLIVPIETQGLSTGDYSLKGFEESGICIERKSHEDAVQTFCHGRDRFENELERMQKFQYAAVIIEADWNAILYRPPKHSRFTPKSFAESVVAWSQRFPKTHWFTMPTRAEAEKQAFRVLRRFWRDAEEKRKEAEKSVS